jgi:cobalt/nickel transport system permease protein
VEHHYLDEYAQLHSPVHRLEPRVKVVAALALILCTVLVPQQRSWPFAVYFALLAAALLLSRLPLAHVLRRAAWLGPFVLVAVLLLPFTRAGDGAVAASLSLWGGRLIVYRAGLLAAEGVLLKAFLCALSVILLVSTTQFAQLLRAMERLRFPRLILLLCSFIYRYLFLLLGELLRLRRAARSRNLEAGRFRLRLRAIGGMVGSLALRSFDRAERVHLAMLSRGYTGTLPVRRERGAGRGELAFLGLFLAIAVGVLVAALLGAGGAMGAPA